ncbi:MAG TPA: response regulator transcription factor [Motilibacterales bacterium]|nr:response regulator transcription factor [Motilibacterales bacterium]
MRILLVEDDHAVRRSLTIALRAQGISVFDVPDAHGARRAVGSMAYDVILLDLGLPDEDGIRLLPDLRRHHAGAIVVLSARRDQSDKVAALDGGADDYMTKPFGLAELLARIRAVRRRAGAADVVRTPLFAVDLVRQEVIDTEGRVVALTATEWAVLAVLARAGGAPVTPEALLAEVWGEDEPTHRNYVRVYINTLRRKLEPNASEPICLRSQPGRGYWLTTSAMDQDGASPSP